MEHTHDENRCSKCKREPKAFNLITGTPECFSAEVRDDDLCCSNFEKKEGDHDGE